MTTSISRRQLLRLTAIVVVAAPFSSVLSLTASAADATLISSDDPTAVALKYVDDAAKAKEAKPGSKCANCTLYQGTADSAQGPCAIFPGKQVKATGWCASWTAKA